MTWDDQMRTLVSLPDNCGTNHGWSDWSWSTETADHGLLSDYFHVESYLFPFFYIDFYLMLQTGMIHKEAHRTSSLEILVEGIQVLLV